MTWRTRIVAVLLALGAAAPVHAQEARGEGEYRGSGPRPFADPGGVIAAEIAFNQLAQAKGQWTAFRQTAADQAVMFVPARVDAHVWLKARADPPVLVKWQPRAVWVSCDGAYAATRGTWRRPDSAGWFVTVWQRQAKGGYKWVLNIGDAGGIPTDTADMIAGKVADCPADMGHGATNPHEGPGRSKARKVPLLADPAIARSPDATLAWQADIDARGAGTVTVTLLRDGARQPVVREHVGPRG